MAGQFRISPARWLFLALLGAGIIGLSRLGSCTPEQDEATAAGSGSYRQIYDADVPPEQIPEQLIGGLILLTPEQLARTPEADGFQWPCGTPGGAMTYDAQPFGSPNEVRGGQHTGVDINGIGGSNTDLGTPIRAAARGLVVYAGTPSEGWGKVVVLAHRLPDSDRIIQTLYAHLDRIEEGVMPGCAVARGDSLGTMGTADGRYLAHLHFEAIESRCTEAGMPGYGSRGTMNRLDPAQLMREYPAPAFPDAYGRLRDIRLREALRMQSDAAASPAAASDAEGGGDLLIVSPADYL